MPLNVLIRTADELFETTVFSVRNNKAVKEAARSYVRVTSVTLASDAKGWGRVCGARLV